jgi:hypothetical protein
VVETAAFFGRTAAPLFDPYLDGWWLQGYNKKRFPLVDTVPKQPTMLEVIEGRLPRRVKKLIRMAARPWLPAPKTWQAEAA